MKTSAPARRCVLVSLLVSIAALSAQCLAQSAFPNRTVRMILPTPPGGGGDTLARLFAQRWSERWGRPVVIDNRTGASGMIAYEAVARSAPDGHTLLFALSTMTMLPATHRKIPYDTLRDFAPITEAASLPNIVLVHPSVPAKSVNEMIAFARSRPSEILYASAGHGTSIHLAMELFSSMAGIRLVHVPYKSSGNGLTDLIAGHVAIMATNLIWGLPQVRAGRLRTLGVTSLRRAAIAPDIPTIAESGLPGYEAVQWYGLLGPAGTPGPIIEKIYRDAADVLNAADIKERLSTDGAIPIASPPDRFAAFMKAEVEKWGKVVKAAGIAQE